MQFWVILHLSIHTFCYSILPSHHNLVANIVLLFDNVSYFLDYMLHQCMLKFIHLSAIRPTHCILWVDRLLDQVFSNVRIMYIDVNICRIHINLCFCYSTTFIARKPSKTWNTCVCLTHLYLSSQVPHIIWFKGTTSFSLAQFKSQFWTCFVWELT